MNNKLDVSKPSLALTEQTSLTLSHTQSAFHSSTSMQGIMAKVECMRVHDNMIECLTVLLDVMSVRSLVMQLCKTMRNTYPIPYTAGAKSTVAGTGCTYDMCVKTQLYPCVPTQHKQQNAVLVCTGNAVFACT